MQGVQYVPNLVDSEEGALPAQGRGLGRGLCFCPRIYPTQAKAAWVGTRP